MSKSSDPDGCWEWTGYRTKEGYGRISANGTLTWTHRLSWEIHFGPIPEGLWVLHRCDNPPCCNPAHLFLGKQRANMADAKAKGRMAHGETHTYAVLTEEAVASIRRRYVFRKVTAKMLASEYGVSDGTIRDALARRTWKHVP